MSEADTTPIEMPHSARLMGGGQCRVTVVEFDFENKVERSTGVETIHASMDAGRFVWVDVDVGESRGSSTAEASKVLSDLHLISEEIIEDALSAEPATQHARYQRYLHLVVSGCRLHGVNFELERVDIVMLSAIFLPLSFLCGVYGMNFEVLPETKWTYGYLYFWLLAAVIVTILLTVLRRSKLL